MAEIRTIRKWTEEVEPAFAAALIRKAPRRELVPPWAAFVIAHAGESYRSGRAVGQVGLDADRDYRALQEQMLRPPKVREPYQPRFERSTIKQVAAGKVALLLIASEVVDMDEVCGRVQAELRARAAATAGAAALQENAFMADVAKITAEAAGAA